MTWNNLKALSPGHQQAIISQGLASKPTFD